MHIEHHVDILLWMVKNANSHSKTLVQRFAGFVRHTIPMPNIFHDIEHQIQPTMTLYGI